MVESSYAITRHTEITQPQICFKKYETNENFKQIRTITK